MVAREAREARLSPGARSESHPIPEMAPGPACPGGGDTMVRPESVVRKADGSVWWERPTSRAERLERILACLREDSRMPFAEISRRTGIPTSTVFDLFQRFRERFWFTAVFLDERGQTARKRATAAPTLPHHTLVEVLS